MIPLGIITCLFLSNIPDTVQWLNNSEKQLLTNLLRHDAGIANGENVRLSWRQAFYVFVDWRIYLYALIDIGILSVIKYINTYLPLLVEDMGNSKAEAHLMTAPPYVFAFVFCLLVNYSSSRRNEHGFHLMFCLSVTLVGFILMLTLIDRGQAAQYVSICIVCCGILSAYPLLLSWSTNNVGGYTKRAIAIGFVVGIGQIGGIILPFVHYDDSTNRRNNFIYLGMVAASLVLVIILRICLMLENRWRDNLSREKNIDPWDATQTVEWTPYSNAISSDIEEAYKCGFKQIFVDGHCRIDLKHYVEEHINNPHRQRPVRRRRCRLPATIVIEGETEDESSRRERFSSPLGLVLSRSATEDTTYYGSPFIHVCITTQHVILPSTTNNETVAIDNGDTSLSCIYFKEKEECTPFDSQ
ncbi:unnamed protein product [Rotaria sordida]|uniref:WWE domain-containing protein n=1 Tax=Rotaria sordida TaxID=392033 RepID=A0A814YYK7_9BILA|nr:unnamed protein product [Rotaria sordida]